MAGDEDRSICRRISLKTHPRFNNYTNWKDKLRENCYRRVREDRTRLMWRLRLPEGKDHSLNDKDFMKSTFQEIVHDELKKIKVSSFKNYDGILTPTRQIDDALWEYDGLHTAYQGECEEIMLEMQRIFYEDLRKEPSREEPASYIRTWEDEEDEYLAHAVFEHMHLTDEQVDNVIWCPVCKQGKLEEDSSLIYCTLCELKLNRDDQVTLDSLKTRLAEAHVEHLDRGCTLKPKFCIDTRFDLTALYIECQGCSSFEVVI